MSGLITGQDLQEQLSGLDLGEKILIPCSMLKGDEEIFLDDMHTGRAFGSAEHRNCNRRHRRRDLVKAVINPSEQTNKKETDL